MKDKQSLHLIKKYLRDECSAAELLVVKKMIQAGIDESVWQEAIQSEQSSAATSNTLTKDHSEALFNKINTRLAAAGTATRGRQRTLYRFLWPTGIAASLITGTLLFYLTMPSDKGEILQLAVSTQLREQKQLVLDDSSKVWVNSNSTLHYPENFSSSYRRSVSLEGEAFFQVKRNTSKPFVVETGNLAVVVLGTSFNVKSFTDEEQTLITLATGKVEVRRHEKLMATLLPGEQLVYRKADSTFYKRSADVSESYAWREGTLQFTSIPLAEVAPALERWYGVHISISDSSLRKTRITLKQHHERLKNVLDILAYTTPLQYSVKGDTITLFKTPQ